PDSEVPGANRVARLYAQSENNQVIFGPTKSLRVQKGDKVSLQVRASYENPPEEVSGLSANLAAMALAAFRGGQTIEGVEKAVLEAFFDPKALLSDDGAQLLRKYDEKYVSFLKHWQKTSLLRHRAAQCCQFKKKVNLVSEKTDTDGYYKKRT